MPVIIRFRIAALRLARALRRSILSERKRWEIGVDDQGRPCLSAGPFSVVVAPRAVRLFDALHVYCDGAEIWIPLIARLRLRNAVRLVLAEHGLTVFNSAHLLRSRRRASVSRRTRIERQPA